MIGICAYLARRPKGAEYRNTGELLSLLAAAQEPVRREDLAEIVGRKESEVQAFLGIVSDFLIIRDRRFGFNHQSLAEWLTAEDENGHPLAGAYRVELQLGKALFAAWAQRRTAESTAQDSDYLVRHLIAHIPQRSRDATYTPLLSNIHWLQRKLEISGVYVLLHEFSYAKATPTLTIIEDAIRKSTFNLTRRDSCINGTTQFPSQLLARLLDRPERSIREFCDSVRAYATSTRKSWLRPLTGSLRNTGPLLGTLDVKSPVTALATLPDGRLVSGSRDGSIIVWDLKHARLEARLKSESGSVTALAALPKGRIAAGSESGAIEIWNLADERKDETLRWHEGRYDRRAEIQNKTLASIAFNGYEDRIVSLAMMQDGRLASMAFNGTLSLSNPALTKCDFLWAFDSTGDHRILALQNGNLVIGVKSSFFGLSESCVWMWDAVTKNIEQLPWHLTSYFSLALLPGDRVLDASETFRIWDAGQKGFVHMPGEFIGMVSSVVALDDQTAATVAVADNSIEIRDIRSGRREASLEGHSGPVNALICLAGGGLVSGSEDSTIKVWDHASTEKTRPNLSSGDIAILPDDRVALAVGRYIKLWRPFDASGSPNLPSEIEIPLTAVPERNLIDLWNPENGAVEATICADDEFSVTALAILSNGLLASSSPNGQIKIWDIDKWELVKIIGKHSVSKMIGLSDGRLAAVSGAYSDKLVTWDTTTLPPSTGVRLKGLEERITALTALADGRLVAGSIDTLIAIWNIAGSPESELLLQIRTDPPGSVTALTSLSDGNLAAGCEDGSIDILDLTHVTLVAQLKGHLSRITALQPMPDGSLVSGSVDRAVVTWSNSMEPDAAMTFVADAPISSIAYLPRYKTLLVTDESACVHLLRVEQA